MPHPISASIHIFLPGRFEVARGERFCALQTGPTANRLPASNLAAANVGVKLVALAGCSPGRVRVIFLIRNFAGFIELSLTSAHVGKTPEKIKVFSLDLYGHIHYLQVAMSAFITSMIGIAIALPLHFTYGLVTPGYLGLIYLEAAMLLIGTVRSHRALKTQPNPIGHRGADLSRFSPSKALGRSLARSMCN